MDPWAALGDPTRRKVLAAVVPGPRSVTAIADGLPVSRPAVSQHLKVLKEAGLVIDEPDGTRRIYQLNPEGVDALRGYLDQFWNQALTAFKRAVEQDPKEER